MADATARRRAGPDVRFAGSKLDQPAGSRKRSSTLPAIALGTTVVGAAAYAFMNMSSGQADAPAAPRPQQVAMASPPAPVAAPVVEEPLREGRPNRADCELAHGEGACEQKQHGRRLIFVPNPGSISRMMAASTAAAARPRPMTAGGATNIAPRMGAAPTGAGPNRMGAPGTVARGGFGGSAPIVPAGYGG